jgi:hypothetical protein
MQRMSTGVNQRFPALPNAVVACLPSDVSDCLPDVLLCPFNLLPRAYVSRKWRVFSYPWAAMSHLALHSLQQTGR